MNFLITGGCGYIGTQLTKHLLSKKNKVTIVDSCWFGNFHKKNARLKIIKNDIDYEIIFPNIVSHHHGDLPKFTPDE